MEQRTKKLTIEEKISLCSGKGEWVTKAFPEAGIPSVRVSDGPHGLRMTVGKGDNFGLAGSVPATCFPTESLLACSFDTDLAGQMGKAIAEEAGAAGVCTVLGPGANIKRNPLCGRNFEYLSEDPYLSGRMAEAYIRSAEQTGIGTSLKHFACNSQEYFRMLSDSRVDSRTLRELYLAGFEYAVKEGKPSTVMCAYNLLNGTACSDNRTLLTDILREEWGFDGMVVSDWGALNDRAEAFKAGCDLIMPGGSCYGEDDALKAVKCGELDETYIDTCAERVARFAAEKQAVMQKRKFKADLCAHHALAEQIALSSAVLLKNNGGVLPLSAERTALIGSMAEHFRIQGSGSSKVNPAAPSKFSDCFKPSAYAPGYMEDGSTDDTLIAEAVKLAADCETALIIAGLPEQYEAEGLDRRSMALPEGMNRLIEAVVNANPRTVVVLICGCAVELPWEEKVSGILWMGLGGEAAPEALSKLLTGKVSPSGRLAETWPLHYEDVPSASIYLKSRHAEYVEGIYVGYRYYEKAGIPVRYPFGHGLSYSRFAYENMRSEGNKIMLTVKNVGTVAAGEAVLLYIIPPKGGLHRPQRELKGFQKVYLQPGESIEVCFELDMRSFAVWNEGWAVYGGEYIAQCGELSVAIAVDGEKAPKQASGWYDTLQGAPNRQDWLAMLGRIPEEKPHAEFTANSTLEEVAQVSRLVRLAFRVFERIAAKQYGRDSADYLLMIGSARECPLRTVQQFLGIRYPLAKKLARHANKKLKHQ